MIVCLLLVGLAAVTARAQSIRDSRFEIRDLEPKAFLVKQPAIDIKPTHKFFDTQNVFAFGLGGLMMVMDIASTRRALQIPGAHEANPLMGNSGVAVALKAGLFGGSMAITYALHRSGHHRMERVLPFIAGAPSLAASIHNFGIH